MRVKKKSVTPKSLKASGFRVTQEKWLLIKALSNFLSRRRNLVLPDVEREAAPLRDELRADILSVLDGKSAEHALRQIIRKIEAMNLTSYLGIWRWESKTRQFLSKPPPICNVSGPFEVKGEKLFLFDTLKTNSLRETMYWTLYQSLKAGEFLRLRKCLHCPEIFVPKDLKREFCSNSCKDTYNNERRKREGYFTDLWRMKRKNALARARALLREGKPLRFIEKETGLTRRILEREKLVKA